jgi:hypothetical protein
MITCPPFFEISLFTWRYHGFPFLVFWRKYEEIASRKRLVTTAAPSSLA